MRKDRAWATFLGILIAGAVSSIFAIPLFMEYPLSGFFSGWGLMHGSFFSLGLLGAAVAAVFGVAFALCLVVFRALRIFQP